MFPPVAGFKRVFKKIFFVDFRVTVQMFKERGNIKTCNFGIGVQQQFGTTYHV